ncbi:MAG: rhamnogalacturonan lyase [Eubacteriales bacterium]|nr:rhamnogalacturonan lyase [Eubacteriales bacterium]
MNIRLLHQDAQSCTVAWDEVPGASAYRLCWSDRETDCACYKRLPTRAETSCVFRRVTDRPYRLRTEALDAAGRVTAVSDELVTPVHHVPAPQLEKLNRGLVAVRAATGVFLSWRLMREEALSATREALQGADFRVYRNGEAIATVHDSCNYIDPEGCDTDEYAVAAILHGVEEAPCAPVRVWEKGYYDLPLQIPEGGVTPAGQPFTYTANDMSVGDVDGDGEMEYIVKWDPTNSQDVSIKGYTGRCLIDCYRLNGTLLWRLDMGPNIRAGAHYTQFMVYDFDGDGRAEMSVKTAPGTVMTRYNPDGSVLSRAFVTMPQSDLDAGWSHEDNYVCSAEAYRAHVADMFEGWHRHPEVVRGQWPATLEACFGIPQRYDYPLARPDAEALADYFIREYAPARSPRNELWKFEGFIYDGPEYLTMFAGDGREIETIPFPFPRVDDGLMWGDYAWNRIEPCNRVDRFLSGVAYLDGAHPSLIVCRGYYTRTCIAAYDLHGGAHHLRWQIDSGFLPMVNPFRITPEDSQDGTDPVYGCIARQGNHSLSCADVDGDGCMEIIYGAACIDHDGSVKYSATGLLPDGRRAKLGHGDSMHVADIDPDVPGLEVFNVFEEGRFAPYGFALRDAETGAVRFGEYHEGDLGRCMIGDVAEGVRGLQVWSKGMFDCKGNRLDLPEPSTNARIYWMGDLTTQVTDTPDYLHSAKTGRICDLRRGVILEPEGTLTNNGTKGNPCLIADIFGDFREELLLRLSDSSSIRIYTSTDLTHHKLPTLLHDPQYRCGVAWQNNCYNQPVYPSFYYASDMDFRQVYPWLGSPEEA